MLFLKFFFFLKSFCYVFVDIFANFIGQMMDSLGYFVHPF